MFTEKIILDSEYAENISLSELQPPQFRTICYVLSGSFLHLLLYDSTLLFFFFFLFSLSFFPLFLILMLFVRVHKISILSSLCPNNFFFFFCTKFLLWLLFHLSDLCIITTFFFKSINLSFTWALSIQFSSYFIINNIMLFDLVLNFKTRTMSQILELLVLTYVLI